MYYIYFFLIVLSIGYNALRLKIDELKNEFAKKDSVLKKFIGEEIVFKQNENVNSLKIIIGGIENNLTSIYTRLENYDHHLAEVKTKLKKLEKKEAIKNV